MANVKKNLNGELRNRILRFLRRRPSNAADLAAALGTTAGTVYVYLHYLRAEGLVEPGRVYKLK